MSLIINPFADPEPDDDGDDNELLREDMERLLREMIEANRYADRPTRSQELLDELARACLDDGEIEVGTCVAIIHGLRVAGLHLEAAARLLAFAAEAQREGGFRQVCRVCGCTDDRACIGGCEWVEFDLCSRCVGRE